MCLAWGAACGTVFRTGVGSPGARLEARPANTGPARGQDKSVEALAEIARPAVVVISHFGRDGKEDGVGAGFIISSNGLIATSLHVIGEPLRSESAYDILSCRRFISQ